VQMIGHLAVFISNDNLLYWATWIGWLCVTNVTKDEVCVILKL